MLTVDELKDLRAKMTALCAAIDLANEKHKTTILGLLKRDADEIHRHLLYLTIPELRRSEVAANEHS